MHLPSLLRFYSSRSATATAAATAAAASLVASSAPRPLHPAARLALYANNDTKFFRLFYFIGAAQCSLFAGMAILLSYPNQVNQDIHAIPSTTDSAISMVWSTRFDSVIGKPAVSAILATAGCASLIWAHRFARSHVSRIDLIDAGKTLQIRTCAIGATGINGSRPFLIPIASASVSAKAFTGFGPTGTDLPDSAKSAMSSALHRGSSTFAAIIVAISNIPAMVRQSVITISGTHSPFKHTRPQSIRLKIDRGGSFPNPRLFDDLFARKNSPSAHSSQLRK